MSFRGVRIVLDNGKALWVSSEIAETIERLATRNTELVETVKVMSEELEQLRKRLEEEEYNRQFGM